MILFVISVLYVDMLLVDECVLVCCFDIVCIGNVLVIVVLINVLVIWVIFFCCVVVGFDNVVLCEKVLIWFDYDFCSGGVVFVVIVSLLFVIY